MYYSAESMVFRFGTINQFTDGTIVGTGVGADSVRLVDKSGNGYDIYITFKDFTTTTGIPYKSGCFLQQKASTWHLINDSTHFWFNATTHAPNLIPVTSLFQDIDYADVTFCRHLTQLLDGNNVETREPCVIEIVNYTVALTGTNLTNAISYFNVPTRVSGAKWVAKTGNDGTGDGTEGNPWLTINKATNTNGATTIYVKSGYYKEDAASVHYLSMPYTTTVIGVGLVRITSVSTTYVIVGSQPTNTAITLKNVIISQRNVVGIGICEATANKKNVTLDRVCFDSTYTAAIKTGDPTNEVNVTNSIFKRIASLTSSSAIYGPFVLSSFNGNFVDSLFDYALVLIKMRDVKYNKFYNCVGADEQIVNSDSVACLVFNNTFKYKFTALSFTANCVLSHAVEISYNTFITASAVKTTICRSTITSANLSGLTFNIHHNSFTQPYSQSLTGISYALIYLRTTQSSYIENNTFTNQSASTVDFIKFVTPTTTLSPQYIRNNTFYTKSTTGFPLSISGEESDGGVNGYPNSEISGNRMYGASYYNKSVGTNNCEAIIACWGNNTKVNNNYINGFGCGVVMKSSGRTYTVAGSGANYNLIIDCFSPIWFRAIKFTAGTVFNTGNTIYNDSILCEAPIKIDTYGTQTCSDIVFQNTLIYTKSLNYIIYMDTYALGHGCDLKNSNYTYVNNPVSGYILASTSVNYTTLALAQAATYMSGVTNTSFTFLNTHNQFWLSTPISGVTLNAAYNTGLDVTYDWNTIRTTKQQSGTWQMGAFVK